MKQFHFLLLLHVHAYSTSINYDINYEAEVVLPRMSTAFLVRYSRPQQHLHVSLRKHSLKTRFNASFAEHSANLRPTVTIENHDGRKIYESACYLNHMVHNTEEQVTKMLAPMLSESFSCMLSSN